MNELVRGERTALTFWEKGLRLWSVVLIVVSLGFAAIYLYAGLFQSSVSEYPYATNSVAKDILLAGFALFVARDVRRYAPIGVPFIILVHAVMPVLLVATLIAGRNTIDHTMTVDWFARNASFFRWTWFASDVLMVVMFTWLGFMAARSRYGLRYLWPSGYRALIALAEVLVLEPDPDRELEPAEIGHRVDRYLASFKAPEKWKVWASFQLLAYWPIVSLHLPFHLMSPKARRRWVERRFLDETRDWMVPRVLRDLRRAIIRTAQQFSFMGYYGDERAAAKAGYVPFSKRKPALAAQLKVQRRGVECLRPDEVGERLIEPGFVIAGTGAAGATLAHELAGLGYDVLLLERGSHVQPSTFTENEADQLARLYRDGALTLSKDFRFQVAQGMCVGGSTVVNNAVCFDLPDDVRDRWNGPEFKAGLNKRRLAEAFVTVRKLVQVKPLMPAASRNPGGEYLAQVVAGLPPAKRPIELELNHCNIGTCLGCGYCNLGCAYGKKLSALDWTLPEAQRKFPGKVRVLPDCMVRKVVKDRDGNTTVVKARLADGRRITIHGQSGVILSAGALASSVILQRSGLGGDRAGRGLSFNMASPVTLEFDRELHSERGAQMSHTNRPNGVLYETWFNPIVTQSLFMPGWFDRHWQNMRRYAYMTCLGVVVGTGNDGTVKKGLTRGGVNFDYEPSDDDFIKIKRGVEEACRIGFELGAVRAMPATLHGLELLDQADLPKIESAIGDSSELLVNTSHPQGGNPMSTDPELGVVDERFRVYGARGLYVCDASVFPCSITVNPQLTVMALAAYAAKAIAEQHR